MVDPEKLKAAIEAVRNVGNGNSLACFAKDDFRIVLEAAAAALELREKIEISEKIQTKMAMDRTNLRDALNVTEKALQRIEEKTAMNHYMHQVGVALGELGKHAVFSEYEAREALNRIAAIREGKL